MRELLTGLAIVLIVVLTTILVAPYFVDWNGQRGFLEARLSQALGQPVTIGGDIDLKLLPTPYLVLDQVVVGRDDGPLRISIHHLDLELSATPLLHGAFDITEARLTEPAVQITLQADHALPALPSAPAFTADVRFDRIHVSDGTLAIADPSSGRTFRFDHLDFDADAGSFAGPFKVGGESGPRGARTGFRLSTAAPQDGRAHAHFVVDETPAHAAYDFDGQLNLEAGSDDAVRPAFEGTAKLSGHLAANGEASIPWKLSGPFKTDTLRAALDGGELRLGGEDGALTLDAAVKGEFGESANMTLDLSAKQLDIDRLSGAPVETAKPPPPPKLPGLTTLRRLLAALRPPIRTGLDLSVETATYGGDTLSDLQAHLGLGEATQPLRVSADGPGGARIVIDGGLNLNADPAFTGHLALAAENLPRTVEWLNGVAPSFPWKKADVPFQTVKFDGEVKAGGDIISGDRLALTLDRTMLKGSGRVALGEGAQVPKIIADLAADPLDLESLPNVPGWRAAWTSEASPFDLDLRLDAKALKVARAGDGALETGRLKLAFVRSGRKIDLKRLRADNLRGATIDASASLDPRRATLSMSLEAKRLEDFAGLVRQFVPGAISDGLVARAADLSPAKVKIDADLNAPANGAPAPSRLAVAGTLGGTRIEVSTKPDNAQSRVAAVTATLDAPESGALLTQLGFRTLPLANIGRSHATLSARLRRDDRLETTLAATLGATKLDANGRFDTRQAGAAGSGTLRLQSPDLTPLLQSLAIAFPDMTGRVPADVTSGVTIGKDGPAFDRIEGRVAGTGIGGALAWHAGAVQGPAVTGSLDFERLSLAGLLGLSLGPEQAPAQDAAWSREPFDAGLVDPPHGAVSLKAKTLEIVPGLVAADARLDLDVTSSLLKLDRLRADLRGGHVEGNASLRRDGKQATVEGRLAFDKVAMDSPALRTRLSGSTDFAGGGASAFALVASLAGRGDLTADDLTIPGADPTALPRTFHEIENDILTVDEESVMHAFAEAAGKGPLFAGTRHFGLSVVGGAVHLVPKDPALPAQGPVSSKIDAGFDLARSKLDVHVGETLRALPQNWSGPPPTVVVTIADGLGKATRGYDISGFLNAVAARALARETARVEAYEFDLRERAFFNARLQSERRREQERLLAEENARKAEDERKARIDAQRKERQRKEQEERERKAKEGADGNAAERPGDADKGRDLGRGVAGPEAPRPARRPSSDDRRGAETEGPPRRPAPAISDPSTFGRY